MLRSVTVSALFVTTLCVAGLSAQPVLVGTGPAGRMQAWLSGDAGLVVEGWRGAPKGMLFLGHGSEPRFDAAGNLYFTRAYDDGERILRRTTMFVAAGTTQARLLPAGRQAPVYRLPSTPAAAVVKIAVDAGHGGSDPGATGHGLREKDINLDIALRLKALLEADTADTRGGGEWDLLMTRSTDVFVSLSARTNMANAFAARSFLSVHNNAASASSATGSETYCYLNQETRAGGLYRNRLHRELIAAWRLRDRGVKTANFHVLRETRMPASLIEGGFITNAGDAQVMGSAANRQRLALGLLWATQEHHGFRRYTPTTGGARGTLRGVIYDAQAGTGTRIPGALVSLSSGTFGIASASTAAFTFSLPPGTYRYAATAPGYAPMALTRTVTANGTIWGSVGLRRANVPALTGPSAPAAGTTFGMTLRGDARSPAFLLIGLRPGIPVFEWGGFGGLWTDPGTAVTVQLAPIPTGGALTLRFPTPNQPGLRAHLQALVRSRGVFRLTNGAAVQLR